MAPGLPRAAALLLAVAAGAASAEVEFEFGFGLGAHLLREIDPDGRTLVREHVPAPQLSARWRQPGAGDGWWVLDAQAWAATGHYHGRLNTGGAFESRTQARSLVLGLRWGRPLPAAGWAVEGGLEVERFDRHLRGRGGAAGLDERLVQPRLGVTLGWTDGPWHAGLTGLVAPRAPLSVRAEGGVFDQTVLRSGRARGLALSVGRALAPGWQLLLQAQHLAVDSSLPREVGVGGTPLGVLGQPRWTREALQLTLQRRWPGG